jgi:hypothetical protein
LCSALAASALSASPAAAGEWNALDKMVLMLFYLMAVYGIQAAISLVVAVRRGVVHGFRAAGGYLLGSLGAVLASLLLIYLAGEAPPPLRWLFWFVVVGAPPVCWYVAHLLQPPPE